MSYDTELYPGQQWDPRENHDVLRGFCRIIPPKTSHHAKKIVRVGKFQKLADTDKLKGAREIWQTALAPFAPATPISGALALDLEFTWPWRSSDSKRTRLARRIPCTVKPDCDNVAKTVTDVMVLVGILAADQKLAQLTVQKWIGHEPGLRFTVRRVA